MALSDEAKQAIKDSIAIVREDKLEKFLRARFAAGNNGGDGGDGKTPPAKPANEPPARKGAWWGELDTGERS